MKPNAVLTLTLLCLMGYVLCGRAAAGVAMKVVGESLVLVKSEQGRLCFDHVVRGSLSIRSTFIAGIPGAVVYAEGADYVVDYANGTVARTSTSRIPDYSTNCLYGVKDFDHTKMPSFSNHAWFVWADYQTSNGKRWATPNDRSTSCPSAAT